MIMNGLHSIPSPQSMTQTHVLRSVMLEKCQTGREITIPDDTHVQMSLENGAGGAVIKKREGEGGEEEEEEDDDDDMCNQPVRFLFVFSAPLSVFICFVHGATGAPIVTRSSFDRFLWRIGWGSCDHEMGEAEQKRWMKIMGSL